ncbi:MAG: DNA adenine methylase [Christensenellaceae bacterium]
MFPSSSAVNILARPPRVRSVISGKISNRNTRRGSNERTRTRNTDRFALLHAMDDAANIYAHYDTFKSAPPVKWAPLELRMPAVSNENNPENRVFQTDANMLAAYTYSDVAYLDPPVDSRQYGDIYHLPENIAQWAKPELRGKDKKGRSGAGQEPVLQKGAAQVFAALVEGCKAKCILAALPEKQEGRGARSSLKLSAEEMLAAMRKRGEVHIAFPPLPRPRQSSSSCFPMNLKRNPKKIRGRAPTKRAAFWCANAGRRPGNGWIHPSISRAENTGNWNVFCPIFRQTSGACGMCFPAGAASA